MFDYIDILDQINYCEWTYDTIDQYYTIHRYNTIDDYILYLDDLETDDNIEELVLDKFGVSILDANYSTK